jgi:molybdenum cofactor cytidylyltransferase
MAEPVAGVIVAAGLSTRMGRPKMLLAMGEKTILGMAVAAAEESTLDEVIVVTGPDADEVRAASGSARVVWITNPAPEAGSITSLLAGAATAGGAAVMHLLGDMPGLDTATIDTVLAAWREAPSWAAVTVYEDGPGHPLMLSSGLLAALAERTGDKVVWSLIEEAPEDAILRVPASRARPRDINTTEDYETALAEMETGSGGLESAE